MIFTWHPSSLEFFKFEKKLNIWSTVLSFFLQNKRKQFYHFLFKLGLLGLRWGT